METQKYLKDENGQIEFADAIYYDAQMSIEDKIYWLEICVAEGQAAQAERVEVLKRQLDCREREQMSVNAALSRMKE